MGESSGSVADIETSKTEESPFPLTDVDRWVLSQTDEEFHLQTWDDLKEIIGKKLSLILHYRAGF